MPQAAPPPNNNFHTLLSSPTSGWVVQSSPYPTIIEIHGPDGNVIATLDLKSNPPRVILAPGISWDDAGKAFWNGMSEAAGGPPIFPEYTRPLYGERSR